MRIRLWIFALCALVWASCATAGDGVCQFIPHTPGEGVNHERFFYSKVSAEAFSTLGEEGINAMKDRYRSFITKKYLAGRENLQANKEAIVDCFVMGVSYEEMLSMERSWKEDLVVDASWNPKSADSSGVSKQAKTKSPKRSYKVPSACLVASAEALYMKIENRCDTHAEVAFCYVQDSDSFLCAKQKFGQVGVKPREASAVSLSDNGHGAVILVGCFDPAIPVGIKSRNGTTIEADCWDGEPRSN